MDWKTMWHYRLIDFGSPVMDLEDTVQQVRMRSTISGDRLRLRLDNSLNAGEMAIRRMTAAVEGRDGTVPMTVGGQPSPVLSAGESCVTDEAVLAVKAGDAVCVSIEFAHIKGLSSMCQTWAAQSWQSVFFSCKEPDRALSSTEAIPFLQFDIHTPNVCMGLTQADLLTEDGVKTLVMFGDSITHMSYYTDALIRRVLREYPGKVTVPNAGMGGNRLCYDATLIPGMEEHCTLFGEAGCRRFRKDVFGTMRPDAVLVLEGINDISHCFQFNHPEEIPTAELFIAGYTKIVEESHAEGAGIYLCTILPEEIFLSEPWYGKCEALRLEINDWIRKQTLADGVIDFETVAAEPPSPPKLREGFAMDGLHPNEHGGTRMAESLPLPEILTIRSR